MFNSVELNQITFWEKVRLLFHRSKIWEHDGTVLIAKVMDEKIYILAQADTKGGEEINDHL